jgi:hypothetical protein
MDRIVEAARRLRGCMDLREVSAKDRRYLKDALPKEIGLVP